MYFIEDTCRTCAMFFSKKDLIPIFENFFENYNINLLYYLKVLELEITKNDGLPQKICRICLNEFLSVDKFRNNCKKAQEKIKDIIISNTNNDYKDDLIGVVKLESTEIIIKSDSKTYHENETHTDLSEKESEKVDLINNVTQSNELKRTLNTKHNQNEDNKIKQKISLVKCKNCNKYISVSKPNRHTSRTCYSLLLNSEKKNVSESSFCCAYCDQEFTTIQETENHFQKFHPCDRPFTCFTCNKFFTKYSNLLKHLKSTHSKHVLFSSQHCKACDKTFTSKKLLTEHINECCNINSNSVISKCSICEKTFADSKKLEKHMNIHDVTRLTFKCQSCNKALLSQKNLEEHERIHTGEKPHICDICGKKFRVKKTLYFHKKIHENNKPFVCKCCAKGFLTSAQLKEHRQIHYNKTGEHQCEYCGQIFKSISNFKFHVGRKHSNENPNPEIVYKVKNQCTFNCPMCPQKFILPTALKKHMTVHDDTRKYPCEECNCAFKSAAHLKRHFFRLHSLAHPFACRFCHKSFKDSEVRNFHERLHNDEKHECKYCHRIFKLKEYLARHERMHTGEKPYSCTLCGIRFSDSQALGKHFVRKHTTEESENLKKQILSEVIE